MNGIFTKIKRILSIVCIIFVLISSGYGIYCFIAGRNGNDPEEQILAVKEQLECLANTNDNIKRAVRDANKALQEYESATRKSLDSLGSVEQDTRRTIEKCERLIAECQSVLNRGTERVQSCRCVQGIEVFLDPRNYTPSYGVFEVIDDDPIDFQSFYAMNKRNLAQQTAAEAKEDVSITTKQVLNLVVQGTDLINKGYMRLKPFQLNSCFVEIETLDIKWLEADAVSIIFTHSKLEESLIIPIVFKENTHKAKVLIPNDVLIPGELTISLCTMDSYGAVNSLVTNGIDYTIYSSDIKPVDFGSTAKFDVYYSLVSTLNTLIADLNSKDAKLIELEARVKALEEA